ncbi:helix-turn-helix domain-containing protein [Methanobrevibacter olleyae]|uniref:Helix-turn-helix n=1 Tax=Methanobrevibacter olleyae TaxID=294671 RepID=A0A126R0W3_METOL|nr:helix-turn-helix transcriptional regulator [Methanobrevibacter olleyae]AMK15265.1 transcriptional regulator [Methanobrevibacter olleyae]SFL28979.1 Helix-turn-helix [Methanobrevibacter olleyae]
MAETVGERLKKLRNANNFTQNQIAEYLGFKQGQIAKLENNERKLKGSSVIRLSNLYRCSPEYITLGIGEYSKTNLAFRSDKKNLSLEDISDMNRIINNLEFLSRITNK